VRGEQPEFAAPPFVPTENARQVALANNRRLSRLAAGEVTHHGRIAVQLDQQVSVVHRGQSQYQALGLHEGVHTASIHRAFQAY
jgi:hypothetical protein